jgi:hypothetical protein
MGDATAVPGAGGIPWREAHSHRTHPETAPQALGGEPSALALAVAVGLGTGWSVYPHGGLTLGHLVLLALLPVIASGAWGWKRARLVLTLLALWGIAAVVTAASVHDTTHHLAFALCRPLTLALSFSGAIWAFTRGSTVLRAYTGSLVIGLAAAVALFPSPGFAKDPWKFGLGPVASLAAVLIAALLLHRYRPVPAAVLVSAAALTNLGSGFRSEFLVVSLAAATAVLAGRRGSPGSSWGRCLGVGAAMCAATAVISLGYGFLAGSGQLGADQQYKWDRQNRVAGGLLIGGRAEVVGSAVVIRQSVIIGRGISPQVSLRMRQDFLQRLHERGVHIDQAVIHYYFGQGLYLHSTFFQMWAETGVLALPGLLLPVVLVGRALLDAARCGSGPAALVFSFLLYQLSWDLVFSPWPRLDGVTLGTAAAAAVVYLAAAQKRPTARCSTGSIRTRRLP